LTSGRSTALPSCYRPSRGALPRHVQSAWPPSPSVLATTPGGRRMSFTALPARSRHSSSSAVRVRTSASSTSGRTKTSRLQVGLPECRCGTRSSRTARRDLHRPVPECVSLRMLCNIHPVSSGDIWLDCILCWLRNDVSETTWQTTSAPAIHWLSATMMTICLRLRPTVCCAPPTTNYADAAYVSSQQEACPLRCSEVPTTGRGAIAPSPSS
jgi:hypothetical protein